MGVPAQSLGNQASHPFSLAFKASLICLPKLHYASHADGSLVGKWMSQCRWVGMIRGNLGVRMVEGSDRDTVMARYADLDVPSGFTDI